MSEKCVLITGATGYFGTYLVENLSPKFKIIATSRDLKKLKNKFGPTVEKIELNLDHPETLEAALEPITNRFKIYGLINNAYDFSSQTGFNTPEGKLESIKVEMLRKSLESGLLAPMVLTQAVGKHMIQNKIKGSIINISSMYGLVSPDPQLYKNKSVFNPVGYGIAKAGLNALTRYTAAFWGSYGIRCNSVAPGAFPNVETTSANAPRDEEFLRRLEAKTVLGRTGHPKDLIGLISLLLSEESSYITGQTISVDGGWTIT